MADVHKSSTDDDAPEDENDATDTEPTTPTEVTDALEAESLTECEEVSEFTPELPTRAVVETDGIYVHVHERDYSAVVTVDFPAGAGVADTAYCGDVADAYRAVQYIVSEHEAEVAQDDGDLIDT